MQAELRTNKKFFRTDDLVHAESLKDFYIF